MSTEQQPLPVDTEGTPIIVECLVPTCLSLDLDLQECARGRTWIFTCGEGHWAWITQAEEDG